MRSYFNLCFFSFYTQHPRQIILQSYTDLELTLIIITASLVIKGIKGSLSICCNLATVFSSVIKINGSCYQKDDYYKPSNSAWPTPTIIMDMGKEAACKQDK